MKNSPVLRFVFATWLFAGAAAVEAQSTAPATQSTYYPTKLTLHASPATQPASPYRLLPDPVSQTPGNAVTLYLLARRYWPDQKTTNEVLNPQNRKYNYLDTPIDEFPAEDARHLLDAYSETLIYADLGARRRDAIWDTGWRERAFGGSYPFSYLDADLRHVENLLSFRARLQISHHDWQAALYTMQTEFGIARHVETEPLVINALVASGFADITLSTAMEEWVSREGSPNLYWALTDLPVPFVPPQPVSNGQELSLRYWKPQIWEALHGRLTAQQWPQVIHEMVGIRQDSRPPFKRDAAKIDALAAQLVKASYPTARQYLSSEGTSREQLDAMSAEQIVGTYFCEQYSAVVDELWRAFPLPFSDAQRLMLRTWRRLNPSQPPAVDNPLIQAYLITVGRSIEFEIPSLLNIRYQLLRPDRQIALMRTIEALRDYAAHHDGQPPERLDQITDLPLPADPMTNEPFGYRLEGRIARLDAPPPIGRSVYSGWQYILTFEK